MKDKDYLFHLIKTLRVSERGYFTKYAFKNRMASSDKLQLKIFTWLSKQELYNEKEMKRLFFNENNEHMRIVKHHLYNRIVASLNEYTSGEGVENYVSKKLASAKTLISKGLYASAEKHAVSACEEALLAERYDLAYTALQTLRDSIAGLVLSEQVYERITALEKQQRDCLQKLDNLLIYRSLLDRFKIIEAKLSSIDYLNNEFKKEMSEVTSSPCLLSETYALSFEARCMYYLCKSYVYNAEKNMEQRHQNSSLLVRHIESQPQKMKYYRAKYRTAINQYLNTCFSVKNFDDFEKYLQKLISSGKNLNPHLSARNFLMIENLKLNRNFIRETVKENIREIKQFETELKKHEMQLPVESFHALYMNAAITFFHEEHYKEAIVYVNKILNQFDERRNKAVIAMAKMINMIAHYELKNYDLLLYLIKIYAADEKKQSREPTAVTFISNALQLLMQDHPNEQLIKNLESYRRELMNDKTQNRLLEDAYVHVWLKKEFDGSKIDNAF